jgi:hypothetical protein
MSSNRARIAVAATLVLLACDRNPSAPGAELRTPTFSSADLEAANVDVDARQSVTGHYEFVGVNTGNDFKYSFSAVRHLDGSVSGEVEERTTLDATGELQRTMHGTVTCFTIIGNMAFVAGIVDRVLTFVPGQENLVPGAGFRFVVVDNGNGSEDPADLGSNARFGVPSSSAAFCENGVAFNLTPVEHGNVVVWP